MANPDDIAKLLDQLSGSSAWQEAIAQNSAATEKEPVQAAATPTRFQSSQPTHPHVTLPGQASSGSSSRVNELLKLLDPSSIPAQKKASAQEEGSSSRSVSTSARKRDMKDMSFAEALPELAGIAPKPIVIKHLIEIRDEQHRLEKRYWERRQEVIRRQEAQIKELKTKVSMTGPLGAREIERLKQTFQQEIFDLEQDEFLPEWDRLLGRQQATLERIGIPLMFETSKLDDRNKQQQIVTILESLMETANR